MAQKLYNTKFCSCKHDQDSYKRQLVACQLHSDWLQMTKFLVVTIIEGAERIEWLPDFHLDNKKKNIKRLSDIALLDTNQIIR
jgi:hypothetical protein